MTAYRTSALFRDATAKAKLDPHALFDERARDRAFDAAVTIIDLARLRLIEALLQDYVIGGLTTDAPMSDTAMRAHVSTGLWLLQHRLHNAVEGSVSAAAAHSGPANADNSDPDDTERRITDLIEKTRTALKAEEARRQQREHGADD